MTTLKISHKVFLTCILAASLLAPLPACTTQSENSHKTTTEEAAKNPNPKADYQKLASDSFPQEKISSAKSYVERYTSLLSQIALFQNDITTVPGTVPEGTPDDTAVYTEINSKLEIDKAVYLMLRLEKDFGSMEKVFDEYLLCLQIDQDLESCLSNKNAYKKSKEEKLSEKAIHQFVTYQSTEQKSLELLQKQNERNTKIHDMDPNGNISENGPVVPNPEPEVPKVEMPEVPKPQEPTINLQPGNPPGPNINNP